MVPLKQSVVMASSGTNNERGTRGWGGEGMGMLMGMRMGGREGDGMCR